MNRQTRNWAQGLREACGLARCKLSSIRPVANMALGMLVAFWSVPSMHAAVRETVSETTKTVGTGQDQAATLDAHLEAGEYQRAQELAASQAAAETRNEWLGRIAEHQAERGAIARSVETASFIDADQARASTLRQIRGQEYGQSAGGGAAGGARGGGVVADFDSLMDLIQNTIAVDSWSDVGGVGSMEPFAAGVHVDASGTLQRIDTLSGVELDRLREIARSRHANPDLNRSSSLRMISLNRLEKEVQLRHALGQQPTEEMQNLAGLQKVEYLFVYPDSNDVVIAGPAGEWTYDADGRAISLEGNQPILQLDDLVVCLRNAYENDGIFGCSIDPRPENLEATQRFLSTSRLTGQRWRDELRSTLGLQDIRIYGIDTASHAAHVLIEADYRMKLVGMGLEDGVLGVESYLDQVELDANGNPPPMDVIRWWFAMKYDSVAATPERNAYQFRGPAVHVLSESEFLDEDGERRHTGRSSEPTARFAESFSRHFEAMCDKYPVYGELRNVFDLALVSALIREESLSQQIDWNLTYFGSAEDAADEVFDTSRGDSPRQVDTILNHRVIESRRGDRRLRHTIVGVSGGVVADTRDVSQASAIIDVSDAVMESNQQDSRPVDLEHHDWWWD